MTTLRKTAATLALAGALLVAGATSGGAQVSNCAPRDIVMARLAQSHSEKPMSLGITASGALLEVLVGPKGTWTIVVTLPNGPTCLVSHGESWQERQPSSDDPLA